MHVAANFILIIFIKKMKMEDKAFSILEFYTLWVSMAVNPTGQHEFARILEDDIYNLVGLRPCVVPI